MAAFSRKQIINRKAKPAGRGAAGSQAVGASAPERSIRADNTAAKGRAFLYRLCFASVALA